VLDLTLRAHRELCSRHPCLGRHITTHIQTFLFNAMLLVRSSPRVDLNARQHAMQIESM
jgi:hypothetical protein